VGDDRRDSGVRAGLDDDPGFPDCREEFEAGDKDALLWVLMICSQCNYRMPEWAREEFYWLYWRGARGEFESWDDVFGKPWGPGQQRAAVTNHKGFDIWGRVRTLHTKEHAPIDNELFERVGKEFGVSRSVASRLYYEHERPYKKMLEKVLDPQLRKILGRN
jgi:hypothetical protein